MSDPGAIADEVARLAGSACPCGSCCRAAMTARHGNALFLPMVVCRTCGNKRCPHAEHHNNACTGSNEPGQTGSSYR